MSFSLQLGARHEMLGKYLFGLSPNIRYFPNLEALLQRMYNLSLTFFSEPAGSHWGFCGPSSLKFLYRVILVLPRGLTGVQVCFKARG